MTSFILIIGLVAVLIIGFLSPHLAGKIEHTVDEKASKLKRTSNWLKAPLAWWAKKSIEMSRKIIKRSAESGAKTRNKIK